MLLLSENAPTVLYLQDFSTYKIDPTAGNVTPYLPEARPRQALPSAPFISEPTRTACVPTATRLAAQILPLFSSRDVFPAVQHYPMKTWASCRLLVALGRV